MEGDELSEFLVTKQPRKSTEELDTAEETAIEDKDISSMKREPLTTKNAVTWLLEGTLKLKVCRYCLNVDAPLHEMDQVFQIGGQSTLYKVTIRDIVAGFYPFQVIEDPNFPNKICEKCLDNALQSYLFTQQCEQAGRALRNCFEDMYEKLEKLDPLDRPKKRGRQKTNPNFNTLYTEHQTVINYAEPMINIINLGSQLIEKNDSKVHELECPRCWQVFTSIESLFNHEKIHPKYMWFSCSICGKSFPKRHLYRKHVRTNHNQSKDIASSSDFKCMECGIGNETYDTHLQHIEKHKFQMVMQHLLERRMDKLCTVCLSKGANMVDLNKTINVHGGSPELTGQRNLYSILGSTMPEKIPYKYQELHIPLQANIVTLKRKHHIEPNEEANVFTSSNEKYHFILSEPIIISRDNFECDDYLFFFEQPTAFEKIAYINKQDEEEIRKAKDNQDVNKNVEDAMNSEERPNNAFDNLNVHSVTDSLNNSGENFLFIFSKPEYDTNIAKTRTIGIGDQHSDFKEISDVRWDDMKDNFNNECTYCWMFANTKKCNICMKEKNNVIGNNIDTRSESKQKATDIAENKTAISEIEATGLLEKTDGQITNIDLINKTKDSKVDTLKDCKYCWIFKNTEKCNNCKKFNAMKNNQQTDKNNEVTMIFEEVITNKRKVVNDSNTTNFGVKRTKWQCKVCLTNNSNTAKCDCCDSECDGDDRQKHVKINLGINKSFFENMKVENASLQEEKYVNVENTGALQTSSENQDETKENEQLQSNLPLSNEIQYTIQENKSIYNPTHSNNIETEMQGNILKEEMDTEFDISQNILAINNKHIFQEEMDVEEYSDVYKPAPVFIPDQSNNTNGQKAYVQFPMLSVTPNAFSFQMGTGNSEDKIKSSRRFIRPLKRMSSSFHK